MGNMTGLRRIGVYALIWSMGIYPVFVICMATFAGTPVGVVTGALTYMGGLIGGPLGMYLYKRAGNRK